MRTESRNETPYAKIFGDGGSAAWDAISRGKTLKLIEDNIEGKPQFFIDIIKSFVEALESRKESTIERDDSSGFRLRNRPSLHGWEFLDIVTWKHMFNGKTVPINRDTAGDWYHIANQNPEIVVLFCKGIGEPIRASSGEKSCRSWASIPYGNQYLTASVPCLEKLIEEHGSVLNCLKLTPSFYWHRPSGQSLFEECSHNGRLGCNRLQDLKTKNPNPPGMLEAHGAVIFGNMRPVRRLLCKSARELVEEEEHKKNAQEYPHFPVPAWNSTPKDLLEPLCNESTAPSLSNQYYNIPTICLERSAEDIVPHVNHSSSIYVNGECSRQEHVKTAKNQGRRHNCTDSPPRDDIHGRYELLPSETKTVRKRPRLDDLRYDLRPIR